MKVEEKNKKCSECAYYDEDTGFCFGFTEYDIFKVDDEAEAENCERFEQKLPKGKEMCACCGKIVDENIKICPYCKAIKIRKGVWLSILKK